MAMAARTLAAGLAPRVSNMCCVKRGKTAPRSARAASRAANALAASFSLLVWDSRM